MVFQSHIGASALAALLLTALTAPPASAGGPPPKGVYACYDATMAFSPIHGSELKVTPAPFVMFGLIDGSTYADWDGNHGHYAYDASADTLTMTDGSRRGWRYRKLAEWSFALIDAATSKDAYTCPFDATKNPSRGPW